MSTPAIHSTSTQARETQNIEPTKEQQLADIDSTIEKLKGIKPKSYAEHQVWNGQFMNAMIQRALIQKK